MSVILKYMDKINSGMRTVLRKNAHYPLQFDVFFVAPDTAQSHDLDLHNLDGSDFDYFLNDELVDGMHRGVNGVYRFLREAAPTINRCNGQRFIMLIVRENVNNAYNDSMY